MIGRVCKGSNVFSLPVLIARLALSLSLIIPIVGLLNASPSTGHHLATTEIVAGKMERSQDLTLLAVRNRTADSVSVHRGLALPNRSPCSAGLVVLAGGLNPIPFRTRPLNPPAPMVLHLKMRESRSLPGLQSTDFKIIHENLLNTHSIRAPQQAKPPASKRAFAYLTYNQQRDHIASGQR